MCAILASLMSGCGEDAEPKPALAANGEPRFDARETRVAVAIDAYLNQTLERAGGAGFTVESVEIKYGRGTYRPSAEALVDLPDRLGYPQELFTLRRAHGP